ncbi:MAG: ABC transporter ATP-binding protein [Candidatus Methanoperedens sp.]|nr:ABC transporter ATP-binding protein [Candidatus Methanoperedens sp.]
MITVQNLNKKFGKITALNNLNLQVKKGTIHGIVGPEASGKSTLMNVLSTLMRPDSGKVTINNIPLGKGSQIRKIIGFVPRNPSLPSEYTARGLVAYAASLHGIRDNNSIIRVLKQTGLDTVADQGIDRFSPSMIKNVAFAMALVHNPEVLLLDEPMTGLDPVSQKRLKEFLISSNKTVLMTGRDMETVDGLCSSMTVLQNGCVLVDGDINSLRRSVGKGAIEIKLIDVNQTQKLLFELQKQGEKATASGESVYVQFNADSEIPNIIRIAANAAEIKDAKPVKLSIDDVFSKYKAECK